MKRHFIPILLLILVCTVAGVSAAESVQFNGNDSRDPIILAYLKLYDGGWDEMPVSDNAPSYIPSEYDVPINKKAFPNTVFRQYIKYCFDDDKNGILDIAERLKEEEISINDAGLDDLRGIEYLPAIYALDCANTCVERLDLSWNPLLGMIDCSRTGLKSLVLGSKEYLRDLNCNDNSLTAIDLSGCPKLDRLYCGNNPLTGLDLSSNTKLTVLDCSKSRLKTLELKKNRLLTDVYCQENALTYLNVKKNSHLMTLDCHKNPLADLDLCDGIIYLNCNDTKLTSLKGPRMMRSLDCVGVGLRTLDLSRCDMLQSIRCSYNRLAYLDMSAVWPGIIIGAECAGNVYEITADAGRIYFSSIPGFDPERASGWQGCSVEKDHIRVTESGPVTYEYTACEGLVFTFTLDVTFNPLELPGVKIPRTAYTYTGCEITPEVTVKGKVGGKTVTFTENEDYTVSFENNVDSGTANVIVEGINGLKGTVTKSFRIKPAKLLKVTLKKNSLLFTGEALSPEITVKAKLNGKTITLIRDSDYSVVCKNNVNAGEATIIVKGKGNYSGTITKLFTITPVRILKVSLSNYKLPYTGKARKPIPTVTTKVGGQLVTLVKNADYTVKYENNVEIGTATVTITGKGNYTGTVTKSFRIVAK